MRCIGLGLIPLFLILSRPVGATELPEVRGRLLSDKTEASLDRIAAGRARLLLVAFSSEGGDSVRELAYAIREDHPADELPLVHVAALARIPGFFRSLARRSLKKSIPPERHDHVLMIGEEGQETALRELLGDGSAFIVGVDATGSVVGVLQAPESGERGNVDTLIARLL